MNNLRDCLSILIVIVALIAFICAFIGSVIWAMERVTFSMTVAEIEQLRADVQRVDVIGSEDVIGQVVEINQDIAAKKRANELWYTDWLVPDGWDDIEFIKLPERKE